MRTVIQAHLVVCLHVLNAFTQSWDTREQSAGALAMGNKGKVCRGGINDCYLFQQQGQRVLLHLGGAHV